LCSFWVRNPSSCEGARACVGISHACRVRVRVRRFLCVLARNTMAGSRMDGRHVRSPCIDRQGSRAQHSLSAGVRATVRQTALVVSPHATTHQVHSLYGVIFHWIEYETLRPLLCNLLYRMTRPQDVLTWRVHKLYPLSHPSRSMLRATLFYLHAFRSCCMMTCGTSLTYVNM
jgi:hypothetical protein